MMQAFVQAAVQSKTEKFSDNFLTLRVKNEALSKMRISAK